MELTLPHSPESELAVVGCALVAHAEIFSDLARLRSQDFFNQSTIVFFEAMRRLEGSGSQVHIASILDELRASGDISKIEGREAWVHKVACDAPMPQTIGSYIATLKKYATLRKIIAMCTNAAASAHSAGDVDGIVESLRLEIAAIETEADDVGPVALADVIDEAVKTIADRAARGKPLISTGVEKLDDKTGGLRIHQMSVWAGLPGMGKTAAALSVIAANVSADVPALIFSLEMDRQDIVERSLSQKSSVPCQFLINGAAKRDTKQWDRVLSAAKDTALLPFYIDDRTLTCNQICGETHRWYSKKVRNGPALVVVDYLGQIPSDERAENRNREIARMVHRLKATAKSRDMEIHMMILSQLSNEAAKRGGFPQSSDLRDSGEIWAAADLVIFPWRDKQQESLYVDRPGQEPFPAMYIIDKNKSGQVGKIETFWLGPSMTYIGQDEWRNGNR